MRFLLYKSKKDLFRFPLLWGAILMVFLGAGVAQAQGIMISDRSSLSLEIGNWQPNTLNNEPSFDTFGKAGATPYVGLAFYLPVVGNLGVKLSAAYWSLRDVEEVEKVHSLVIHPVRLILKYWLVPDSFLSAYVLYGGGVYWGVENETTPLGPKITKARAGWGGDLGAGFDIALARKCGLGISCTYSYVTFKEELAGVEDFSGPKISAVLYYYF